MNITALPSRGFKRLTVLTVLVTYVLIVVGAIVRVSGSGEGCGKADGADSWPLCHGNVVPPADLQTVIEFSHRIFATLSTAMIAVVLVWALARYRHLGNVVAGAVVTAVLIVVQIVLGALTVQFSLPPEIVLVHLANAELVLAGTVFVAVTAAMAGGTHIITWRMPGVASRIGAGLAIATFVLILSGANVVAQGAGGACDGWPLCGANGGLGTTVPQQGPDAINFLHRIVAGFTVVAIGALVPRIRRGHRGEPGITAAFVAVNMLLLLQIVAGALLVELRLPAWTRGLHIALASALWLGVFLLALLARSRSIEAAATGTAVVGAGQMPVAT